MRSSTVFSVMKRKTRTTFVWPIRCALSMACRSTYKTTFYTQAKICTRTSAYLRVPIAIIHQDYISCGKINTQSTGTSGEKEDEFAAVWSVEFLDLRL